MLFSVVVYILIGVRHTETNCLRCKVTRPVGHLVAVKCDIATNMLMLCSVAIVLEINPCSPLLHENMFWHMDATLGRAIAVLVVKCSCQIFHAAYIVYVRRKSNQMLQPNPYVYIRTGVMDNLTSGTLCLRL